MIIKTTITCKFEVTEVSSAWSKKWEKKWDQLQHCRVECSLKAFYFYNIIEYFKSSYSL